MCSAFTNKNVDLASLLCKKHFTKFLIVLMPRGPTSVPLWNRKKMLSQPKSCAVFCIVQSALFQCQKVLLFSNASERAMQSANPQFWAFEQSAKRFCGKNGKHKQPVLICLQDEQTLFCFFTKVFEPNIVSTIDRFQLDHLHLSV